MEQPARDDVDSEDDRPPVGSPDALEPDDRRAWRETQRYGRLVVSADLLDPGVARPWLHPMAA